MSASRECGTSQVWILWSQCSNRRIGW